MLQKAYTDIHREIMDLSKSGNGKAQFQLYSLYAKAMFNICMRILVQREEAEDALQEAFSEAFIKLDTFRYESAFGAWLKRIVINTCINKINRKKPDLKYIDNIDNESVIEFEPNIEDVELKVRDVHAAIQKLPDGYRIVLSLYLLEGYDHIEISEILGISVSSSKTQYMKAKRKVKEILST